MDVGFDPDALLDNALIDIHAAVPNLPEDVQLCVAALRDRLTVRFMDPNTLQAIQFRLLSFVVAAATGVQGTGYRSVQRGVEMSTEPVGPVDPTMRPGQNMGRYYDALPEPSPLPPAKTPEQAAERLRNRFGINRPRDS